jgi:hypothetical protein
MKSIAKKPEPQPSLPELRRRPTRWPTVVVRYRGDDGHEITDESRVSAPEISLGDDDRPSEPRAKRADALRLPSKPRPRPTDDVWARLRTDHPSQPPEDHMLQEVMVQARRRRAVVTLVALVAVISLGLLVFYALAPRTWRAWRERVFPTPAVPVVVHNAVRFVEPAAAAIAPAAAHEPPQVAPLLDGAVSADAATADTDAPAPAPEPAASRAARRSRRHSTR